MTTEIKKMNKEIQRLETEITDNKCFLLIPPHGEVYIFFPDVFKKTGKWYIYNRMVDAIDALTRFVMDDPEILGQGDVKRLPINILTRTDEGFVLRNVTDRHILTHYIGTTAGYSKEKIEKSLQEITRKVSYVDDGAQKTIEPAHVDREAEE